jgi:hypothetical protein
MITLVLCFFWCSLRDASSYYVMCSTVTLCWQFSSYNSDQICFELLCYSSFRWPVYKWLDEELPWQLIGHKFFYVKLGWLWTNGWTVDSTDNVVFFDVDHQGADVVNTTMLRSICAIHYLSTKHAFTDLNVTSIKSVLWICWQVHLFKVGCLRFT